MSQTAQGDAHYLLFQDYKFGLEDRPFLEKIAFSKYSPRAQRLTAMVRETLRILCAYPGFRADYSLHSEDAKGLHIVEHVTFVGQNDLPFATLSMKTGTHEYDDSQFYGLGEILANFEHALNPKHHEYNKEWWLERDAGNVFQCATLLYEIKRIILDIPTGTFYGRGWDDGHGKYHLFLTDIAYPEFADGRACIHLALVPPGRFNAAVIEASAGKPGFFKHA